MATNYKAEGLVVQYTTAAGETLSSGDVVFIGGVPGIAIQDIAAEATGSVALSGVWEVPKYDESDHEAEFALGEVVRWDPVEKEAVKTAGQPMLGYAYEAVDDSKETVKVLLAPDPKDAPIVVKAGEGLAKYDLVYPSGYDAEKNVLEVKKAEADHATIMAGRVAWYILPAAITINTLGIAKRSLLATGVDTDTPEVSVGTPVYLSGTAGEWTEDVSSTGGDAIQQVGVVVSTGTSDGEVLFMLGDSKSVSVNTTTA